MCENSEPITDRRWLLGQLIHPDGNDKLTRTPYVLDRGSWTKLTHVQPQVE